MLNENNCNFFTISMHIENKIKSKHIGPSGKAKFETCAFRKFKKIEHRFQKLSFFPYYQFR